MEVRKRLLGSLSKGYGQRVGVAQALCGNPEILVLDEPTVGLDPKQVVEIRGLIRRLGQDHTVVFSSHILSEIQQLCQRVVILHRGRLVKEADMSQLGEGGKVLRLRAAIAKEGTILLPALKSLPCLQRWKVLPSQMEGVTRLEMECTTEHNDRGNPQTQLFRLLCGLDAPILSLTTVTDTL